MALGVRTKKKRKSAQLPSLDAKRRERLETGVELGASVAKQLLMWGYDVVVRAPNGVLAPAGGEGAIRPILRLLARLGYSKALDAPPEGPGSGRDLVDEMRVRVRVRVDLESHDVQVSEGAGSASQEGLA